VPFLHEGALAAAVTPAAAAAVTARARLLKHLSDCSSTCQVDQAAECLSLLNLHKGAQRQQQQQHLPG
jgi:hypothetical protein